MYSQLVTHALMHDGRIHMLRLFISVIRYTSWSFPRGHSNTRVVHMGDQRNAKKKKGWFLLLLLFVCFLFVCMFCFFF